MALIDYIHGRTCVYNINYHIVWCVKYRKKVLNDDISNRLYILLSQIGQKKDLKLLNAKLEKTTIYIVLYRHRQSCQ